MESDQYQGYLEGLKRNDKWWEFGSLEGGFWQLWKSGTKATYDRIRNLYEDDNTFWSAFKTQIMSGMEDVIGQMFDIIKEHLASGLNNYFGPIKIALVDPTTGRACPYGWPEFYEDRQCVIEFGDPSWSHTRRAFEMVRAICRITGSCPWNW